MHKHIRLRAVALAALGACTAASQAVTFDNEWVKGNFDSTLTTGLGIRARNPSCQRVGDPSYCASADVFGWANSDDGNLNYRKGDPFTTYVKGNHELLLNFKDDWKFLGRVNWLYDFKADDTARTPLSKDARNEIVRDVRLLDFWVGKTLQLGEQRASVRVGNQFLNWGESLFLPGGVNATNAVDIQRLSQPGTQLKEAFLPAPMLDASASLGHGVSVEGYYQFRWNRSKFPPVGGYWSVVDLYDKGRQPVFLGPDRAATNALGLPESPSIPIVADQKPKKGGQYGLALRYQPEGTSVNFGAYAINYHDKTPNLQFINGQSEGQWTFLENRKLYGVSVNLPLGNWAIGSELSYRPKDAIALSGCFNPGQEGDNLAGLAPAATCQQFIDGKRWQWHLTGLLSLTPGDHGAFLNLLGADTATLLAEAVVIRYPGLKSSYQRTTPDGTPVSQIPAAGLWGWSNDGGASLYGAGTRSSWGYNLDFSWVYDGKLIPGWQVVPEIYFFHAVNGRTPNLAANFMKGAKSANFIVTFIQNPAKWQFAVNYAKYWGGKTPFDQPLGDRDFFGAYLSRNF
jgi:hypothetical protein